MLDIDILAYEDTYIIYVGKAISLDECIHGRNMGDGKEVYIYIRLEDLPERSEYAKNAQEPTY